MVYTTRQASEIKRLQSECINASMKTMKLSTTTTAACGVCQRIGQTLKRNKS